MRKVFRKNTIAVVGVELGDEGKGRIVDNVIEHLLKKKNISKIYVIRFQGGSNSGHSLVIHGKRFAMHQIPSSMFHQNTVGILDRGMVIHPEDLLVELDLIRSEIGSLKERLIVSNEAVLCTDLERAEEYLNGIKSKKVQGGTGRGISPSYAHHYDRLGLHIRDLLSDKWKTLLRSCYVRYEKEFAAYDIKLSDVEVIDMYKTKKQKKASVRKLGSKRTFINRLELARSKLIKSKIVQNTFPIHSDIFKDASIGIIFEGAQSLGLHPWLGTRPDVTSSDTSISAVSSGTGFWRMQDIGEKIGVFKVTYTSSVGARRMPTQSEDEWANWVREKAHEYGTTTGRPRDILYLDLPFLSYNAHMSGIDKLSGTHLDIARVTDNIKVCTHYTRDGRVVSYQPGLWHQEQIKPNYITLPGWDGEKTQKARSYKTLPKNAQKFLSFIQKNTGFPICSVTTGPSRKNFIRI